MKTILRYIFHLFLFYVVVFLASKLLFMAYNHGADEFGFGDVLEVLWHGLRMDLSTAGYLVAIPWLMCLVSLWWRRIPLLHILEVYLILIGLLLGLILMGDTMLYEYWRFKLDASIFVYMSNLSGVTDSVSAWYIVGSIAVYAVVASILCFLPVKIAQLSLAPSTAGSQEGSSGEGHSAASRSAALQKAGHSLVMLLLGGLLFLVIRGGVQEGTMNIGVAYYSHKLFLNHSAVNPAFSLFYSASKYKRFNEQFRFMETDECRGVFASLYPEETEDVTDTLLTTSRPKILYIQLESFGAQFVKELGGYEDVSPNLSRFISEGVFFDNMYANSFRTDRGMVSCISGQPAYPTVSLMRFPAKYEALPSFSRKLQDLGYDTSFLYGGDITYMGLQGYLISSGFQQLTSSADFTLSESNESKWGVNDSTVLERAYETIAQRPTDAPWLLGVLTLSSHEPFEVPWHGLDDKVQNAFAYTDHCLGQFVERLRQLPVWKDLLIVLLADHGLRSETSSDNPEFFRIPMIWMGGAVRQPGRVHQLMNQSDFCATLLSQLGISHKEFRWSRNVLSVGYTYPFTCSSTPSNLFFRDSTGVSVYDLSADCVVGEQPSPSQERLSRAKAILQTSYDELDALGPGNKRK